MKSQLPSVLLQAKYILDETDKIKQSERLWSIYCNILLVRCVDCNTLSMRSIYGNMLGMNNNGSLFGFILCERVQSFTNSSTRVFDTLSPSHMLVTTERAKNPFALPTAFICSAQTARVCFSVSCSLKG